MEHGFVSPSLQQPVPVCHCHCGNLNRQHCASSEFELTPYHSSEFELTPFKLLVSASSHVQVTRDALTDRPDPLSLCSGEVSLGYRCVM
jgi:hypothetical protein